MTEQDFLQFMRERREWIKAYQEKHGGIYKVPKNYDVIPEDKISGMGELLLQKETNLGIKDAILMNFAHQSSKKALSFLRKYKKSPDNETLKFIAETAYEECKMFTY